MAKSRKKKKPGRHRIDIDLDLVGKLAAIQCTIKEIAAILDIPPTTLQDREDFRLVYDKGIENGKASLRRIQFRLAQKSAGMAIWLGKQYLDQTEKNELSIPDADKYLQQIADAIAQSDTGTAAVLPGQPQVRHKPGRAEIAQDIDRQAQSIAESAEDTG